MQAFGFGRPEDSNRIISDKSRFLWAGVWTPYYLEAAKLLPSARPQEAVFLFGRLRTGVIRRRRLGLAAKKSEMTGYERQRNTTAPGQRSCGMAAEMTATVGMAPV